MAMDIDQVLAKVQKMLNVEGRTPEEAAAYVEKAHAILAQYDLTIEDVGQLKADPRTAVAKSDAVATTTRGKPDGWKADLLVAVAASFECKVLRTYTSEYTKSGKYRSVQHYNLVGFKHDLDAARYAFSFLQGEVVRQAKAYGRVHWDAIAALAKSRGISHHDAESEYAWSEGTHPLKAELYFIKGATQTVSRSLLREAAARKADAVEVNPFGLVVQKQDEIDDFIGRERYGDKWPEEKARREQYNAAAMERRTRDEREEVKPEKPETEAQARKRRERERREYDRWEQRWLKEQAKIDHSALAAGQEAGSRMKVAPGIGSGAGKEQIG